MTNTEFEAINLARRASSEVVLDTTKPMLLMLDGRSFSKFTKNNFTAPFCEIFADIMNSVTEYLCKEIQNARIAFVQSDEISIYIEPCGDNTQPWFKGRLNKICSIAAGMASAQFTKEFIAYKIGSTWSDCDGQYDSDLLEYVEKAPLAVFDCKAWNVENMQEVEEWFVYRHKDCERNAVSMWARSYFSHHALENKDVKEMREMTEAKSGVLYTSVPDGFRNGRIVRKYYYPWKGTIQTNTGWKEFNTERTIYVARPTGEDITRWFFPRTFNLKHYIDVPEL